MKPLVTIYTATYNRADLLQLRAIPSVLSQTIQNFEYLIIGDGCTDNTNKIVESFNDPRIKFINLPVRENYEYYSNKKHWFQSGSRAANKALELAQGLFIARIDDDDLWTKTHLEHSLYCLRDKDAEFCTSTYKTKEGIECGPRINSSYYYNYPHEKNKNNLNTPTGCHSSWVYRSYLRFFKYNLDSWRKKYNRVADLDLLVRMNNAGVKMAHVNKPNVIILPRPQEEEIGSKAFEKKMEDY
jgi:glycosyltransferase involved in cell wall biosynthesis